MTQLEKSGDEETVATDVDALANVTMVEKLTIAVVNIPKNTLKIFIFEMIVVLRIWSRPAEWCHFVKQH